MSPQADYVVSNGTGAAVRSDINGQLAAIVSNNSGASAPATTYAYMLWADTSTNLLKLRNGANSAWITVGDLTAANLGLATLASPTFTGTATIPTLTVSTAANIPLGSAASPTLYFTGDSNTGLYSPGADQVALSTGGTGRLFINSSGAVGVGTSAPVAGAQLTVAGSALAVTGQNTDHSANSIRIGEEGSGAAQIRCYGPNTSTNGSLTFRMSRSDGSNSQDVVIDGSGRLGIGTSSPSARLDIAADSGDHMRFIGRGATDYSDIVFYSSANTTRLGYIDFANTQARINVEANVPFRLYTNAQERLTVTAAGNVGIGSNAPSNVCEVQESSTGSGIGGLTVSTANTGGNPGVVFRTSTSNRFSISLSGSAGSESLRFYDINNSSERARIDSSGRLLVGTSSTSTSQGASTIIQGNSSGGSTSYGQLILGIGTATPANGEALGEIRFSDSGHNRSAQITAQRDGGTWTSNSSMPSRLVFSTTADGASSPTERMRISSAGGVCINTTNNTFYLNAAGTASAQFGDAYDTTVFGSVQITRPADQPDNKFHLSFIRSGQKIAGMGFLDNSNTFAIHNANDNTGAGVTLTNGATSWGTTSDERKKRIGLDISSGLEKIADWRCVYFSYLNEEPTVQRIGLIAQDVEKTVPEAVSVEDDAEGTLQLRYTELIPVLVKALQEAKERIETLETKVAALESA